MAATTDETEPIPDLSALRAALRRLCSELRRCERRLGTADERTDDFERALILAHEINNDLTPLFLAWGRKAGTVFRQWTNEGGRPADETEQTSKDHRAPD